jgi:hypothetical protein
MKMNYLLLLFILFASISSFGQTVPVASTKLEVVELKPKEFSANSGSALKEVITSQPATTSSCLFTFIMVNQLPCDGLNNYFSITGSVEFTDAPTTGQLVLEDCNGNSQVFNAPFTSPTNYVLDSIFSDGVSNCPVTAYFTDSLTCSIASPPVQYPNPCVCAVDVGTFHQELNGTSITADPITLCYGDTLDITANGDYTPSLDLGISGTALDPGIKLLIYSCPPTLGPPSSGIGADPCLLGIYSNDDQAWSIINSFSGGGTYWYVPITMYNMPNNVYSTTNGGIYCYDLGPVYEVTFLEEINISANTDCSTGMVSAFVNGGLPQGNGSEFVIYNTQPASATFSTASLGYGDSIVISGLLPSDNWSFDVLDTNGCSRSFSGSLSLDAIFNYSASDFCQDDSTAIPTITGLSSGVFSGPIEVVIDPSSGEIDLVNSLPGGPYTILYTVSNAFCSGQNSADITINPFPTLTVQDLMVCQGDSVTLMGSGAQSYSWSGGILDSTAFLPSGTQTYSVTGTDSIGCAAIADVLVTVNALPAPPTISITGDTIICLGDSVLLTSSVGTGNEWSTGELTQSISVDTSGSYSIIYTDANGCSSVSDTVNIELNLLPIVSMTPIPTNCIYFEEFTLTQGSPAGGTYSGTGVSNNKFSPPIAGLGTFLITYHYTDNNTCVDSASSDVIVDECLSIYENSLNEASISPNPVNNELTINNVGEFNFEIVDARGRLIQQGAAIDSITLDLSLALKGVYFVSVQSEKRTTKLRFMKN